MKTTVRQIQLPGRLRLEFAEQGRRGDDLPVIALHGVTDSCRKVPARVWRAAFAGFMRDDFSVRLREIDVPTWTVWGRHDAVCPAAEQQAMLQVIGGLRLVEYADAGHAMHWEEPQRFAPDLARFTQSVATAVVAPSEGDLP
ncbi:alpha/beta hydrolase [Azohydromonas sp.]|uniref:alpha/beta fold hydrolase n=1 Tax=Azohydromonas sp. TaxID=1872666 RepID=UPI002C79607E|nr:alpha/beta hydrolase [Azohydromonas sp.]HMM86390.1 alpha/beta hydrolase [Azohydromonas sp.]